MNFIRLFKYIILFLIYKNIEFGLCKLNVVKFRCIFCLVENILKFQIYVLYFLNLDFRNVNGCFFFGGFMCKDY